MRQTDRLAYPVLAAGVVAVSFAAILIREADAPALVIAAYRLAFAALPAGALSLLRERGAIGDRRSWRLPVLADVFFAAHLAIWNVSLQHTSVATSVVLRCTSPLFIGLASPFVLRERVARATWLGIALAGAGALLMTVDDLGDGFGTIMGDLLALVAAVFGASYLMTGRLARPAMSTLGYLGIVYPVTAVLLVAAVFLSGDPFTGYTATAFVMFALLALVPTLIGHTAINWSLAFIPAALVSVSILAEPVIASGLAMAILREFPTALEVAGAAVVLAGVYVALRFATQPVNEEKPESLEMVAD